MLRKLAVRSLRKNLQLREEVLQSMAAHGLRYAHLTKEEGVDQFLADLGQPGFPGGRESLRALANITEAHIVVYPEQGHVYEVSSSTTAPLINVSISQRLLTDEQGRTNLQYDSVVEVKPANP
ncbi:hypothetical protein PR048_026842 [Dryococelus australis]|uniref:Uncharacterized protein n=1 Tax=Dryococelus australis TaxID=614101 RepID=A0ABQ9GMH4_9NEOP|nr:hypothetical protein PR048_026842 [Dryococelus australis]